MNPFQAFLSQMFTAQAIAHFPLWCEGLAFSLLGLVLTATLEWFYCVKEVTRMKSTRKGHELYLQAWQTNVSHHVVLGPLTYVITIGYLCPQSAHLTLLQQIKSCISMLVVEGVLYSLIHKAFHEVPGCYWMHRFHHQFHAKTVGVLPSSANAVSIYEFVLAYLMPLSVGAYLSGCDKWSTLVATSLVQIANLYIHTPPLQDTLGGDFWPWVLVSPDDHLRHHGPQRSSDYAAPIFHYDRILRFLQGKALRSTAKNQQ